MNFFEFIAAHPVWILIIYLALVNLALFLIMGIDKSLARREKRRVPETTLFTLCAVGGSLGGVAGMWVFRHKTRHASFIIGFHLILIAHLALAWFIIT